MSGSFPSELDGKMLLSFEFCGSNNIKEVCIASIKKTALNKKNTLY